jgi:hypothetical protein
VCFVAVGIGRGWRWGWDSGWINLNWATSARQFIFSLLKLIKSLVSLLSQLIKIELPESPTVAMMVNYQQQIENFISYGNTTITMVRAFITFAGNAPQVYVGFVCFEDQEVVL